MQTDSIFDYQPNSFIDFPGMVSTVLFLGGCNLRCPYCHNLEVVRGEKKILNSEAFFIFLKKRKEVIEGVVITGGEPTIHQDLPAIVEEIKGLGFKVKLDTNGLNPNSVGKVLKNLDYLAVDVKTSFENYKEKLGCRFKDPGARLYETVDFARGMGNEAEIRVTAVKGLLDANICHEIGKFCEGVDTIFVQKTKKGTKTLLPYYQTVEPFSDEKLEEFKNIFLRYVKHCIIR